MTRLQVEFHKHVKRIERAVLKKYPRADKVTTELQHDFFGKSMVKVVVWRDGDLILSNFRLQGTTKQIIQQINAGALTE